MNNANKKEFYLTYYGHYYEKVDNFGNHEIIDPTKVTVKTNKSDNDINPELQKFWRDVYDYYNKKDQS